VYFRLPCRPIYTEGDLRIIVAEGFRAAEPEDITIGGHVIKGTYAIKTSEKSRLVERLRWFVNTLQ
jgi:hypothetical protein